MILNMIYILLLVISIPIKDMGGTDATWNRFQIGWQIGLNARFNSKFLLGLSYGTDFSEIHKKGKIKTTSITIGYYL